MTGQIDVCLPDVKFKLLKTEGKGTRKSPFLMNFIPLGGLLAPDRNPYNVIEPYRSD